MFHSSFKIYLKSILIPVLVGSIIGLLISSSIDYNMLEKPFLSPPSILFPIVWTLLYILMGISFGILKNNSLLSPDITFIYFFQLFVNALWPILFFVFDWKLFSFFWILLLDFLILVMILKFYKKNKISAYLQIPYLLWSIFASYLNLFIFLLN